ncbi:putative transcription factor B3-Domain family [Helianthus annuus]|nr:putative transcription factor B3-Domain family [Helianthus annuus]KAJ0639659.1 putative transcription factor B3-Domain family [Helianthus annuus]
MDPKNNATSFLKLIDDYDPIFLEIPYDFASLLWGGKVPYGQCLELIDDGLSWVVRLKRNVSRPVLGDGFTKFVKDSGLKKNDYLLVKAIGTSTFYVSVFKSCVFENSFISKVAPDDTFILMADKFWKNFYGKRFKGGEATLYVGNMYWNVKMEGWPDRSAFTDGFSKLIDDLSLDTRSTMLFTSVGYKTFEKVEVVVLEDSIYGDEGFDLLTASKHNEKHETNESHVEQGLSGDSVGDFQLSNFESIFNDTGDSKFNRYIAAQIEMEDAKNLFKDGWNTKNDALKNTPSATSQCHFDTKGKSKVVCGNETVSPKVKSKSDMDLDNFLTPKNKLHVHTMSLDTKGKSKVLCGDETVSPKGKSKLDMDLDNIAYRTRSNFHCKNECVDIDMIKPGENISVKPKRKTCRSTTASADVHPKRKVKGRKPIHF